MVGRDGLGLLPSSRALSDIDTQDEATALVAAIGQQFGLRSVNGLQPSAEDPPEPHEALAKLSDNHSLTGYLPGNYSFSGISEGNIRVKQSRKGPIVSFIPGLSDRLSHVAFSIVCLMFVGYMTVNMLRNMPVGAMKVAFLIFIGFFWVAGFGMFGLALAHNEFFREGGHLINHTRLGRIRRIDNRISAAELVRISTEVYWDSYHQMYHKVVAHVKTGKDITIINPISEADGYALCQALHNHLGIPI